MRQQRERALAEKEAERMIKEMEEIKETTLRPTLIAQYALKTVRVYRAGRCCQQNRSRDGMGAAASNV